LNSRGKPESLLHPPDAWLITAVACLIAVLVNPAGAGVVIAAALGLAGLLFLFHRLLYGDADVLLVIWVVLFPFGYYFLSFPRKGSLITLDRVLIMGLLLAALSYRKGKTYAVPAVLKRAGWSWVIFLGGAALSIILLSKEKLGPARNLVDSFMLPAVLGWFILTRFDVRRYMSQLHLSLSLMSLLVAAVGLAELYVQDDLMAFSAGTFYKVDADGQLLLRVNGPFETNSSFAIIGLTLFLLLLYFKRSMPEMSASRNIVHRIALMCALTIALLPLFRSVMLSLLVMLGIEAFWFSRGWKKKAIFISVVTMALLVVLALRSLAPSGFEDRSKSENLYGRIAQQAQTFRIFLEHPLLGVGFGNFTEAAESEQQSTFMDVASVDAPHNNLGAVMAETGMAGFVPYLAAQIFFMGAMIDLKRRLPKGHPAFSFLLFLWLGYWLNGLALTAGYYSDLNMLWLFATMLVFRHAGTEPGSSYLQLQPASVQA
jgi:hypothetical protein